MKKIPKRNRAVFSGDSRLKVSTTVSLPGDPLHSKLACCLILPRRHSASHSPSGRDQGRTAVVEKRIIDSGQRAGREGFTSQCSVSSVQYGLSFRAVGFLVPTVAISM